MSWLEVLRGAAQSSQQWSLPLAVLGLQGDLGPIAEPRQGILVYASAGAITALAGIAAFYISKNIHRKP